MLQQLTKRLLESVLEGEVIDHRGYERRDPADRDSGNFCNGTWPKTVLTEVGPVEVTPLVMRDLPARSVSLGSGFAYGAVAA